MKILVAGVGNVFLGDDGFGCEVARRLAAGPPPRGGTIVTDYGIRGVHLAYELLNGYDALIIVDAVRRGGDPGTLYVIEPDVSGVAAAPVDAHDMTPEAVLAVLAGLGGEVGKVLVVGCEPADVGEGIGLSEPVAGAVDEAARTVRRLSEELRESEDDHAQTPTDHGPAGRGGAAGVPVAARRQALSQDPGHVRPS
jgi:hydrogenase maturation protease